MRLRRRPPTSRPNVPRRPRRPRVATLLRLLVLALLAAAALEAPGLRVQEIEVVGNARVPAARVVALSEVEKGDFLLAVRPSRVEERLRGDPLIAGANVSVDFPGRVSIEVAELSPVALVPLGSTFLEVAAGGVVIDVRESACGTSLPILTGPIVEPPAPRGRRLSGRGWDLLLGCADRMGAKARSFLSEIHLENEEMTAYTEAGTPVYLGDGTCGVEGLGDVLEAVVANESDVLYVDFRYEGRPFIKMRQ